MKIIGKNEDFYDYLKPGGEITFVRVPGKGEGNLILPEGRPIFELTQERIDYISAYSDYQVPKDKIGKTEFGNIVFGIYPYIYSTPILINYREGDYDLKVLPLDDLEWLILGGDPGDLGITLLPGEDISKWVWKEESPETFKEIGYPIFVHYSEALDFPEVSYHYDWPPKYFYNVTFRSLGMDVLGMWKDELMSGDTVSRIEEFLKR